MKDISDTLEYKGQKYPIVFNLNVLEEIQAEYGTFGAWLDKIAGENEGDSDFEPDIKAIKFAYLHMINEGLDIENEDTGGDRKPVTSKFVGRMFTTVGLDNMVEKLNKLALDSNQGGEDSKNE